MVRAAKDWGWSSYRATAGQVESPSLKMMDYTDMDNYLLVSFLLASISTYCLSIKYQKCEIVENDELPKTD